MQRPWKSNLAQKAGLCLLVIFTVGALYGVMRCSTTDDFCSLQRKGSSSFSRKVIEPDKKVMDRARCVEVTGTKQVNVLARHKIYTHCRVDCWSLQECHVSPYDKDQDVRKLRVLIL